MGFRWVAVCRVISVVQYNYMAVSYQQLLFWGAPLYELGCLSRRTEFWLCGHIPCVFMSCSYILHIQKFRNC